MQLNIIKSTQNVNFIVERDSDIAQINFEDGITRIEDKLYFPTWEYTKEPELSDLFDFSDFRVVRNACIDIDYKSRLAYDKKAKYSESVKLVIEDKRYNSNNWKDYLLEHVLYGESFKSAFDQIEEYLKTDSYICCILGINSYLKGDYAYVLTEKSEDKKHIQYLENLFFDQPLYYRLEINGVDYTDIFRDNLMQLIQSEYDYSKEDIIKGLNKIEELEDNSREYIIKNLPEYL